MDRKKLHCLICCKSSKATGPVHNTRGLAQNLKSSAAGETAKALVENVCVLLSKYRHKEFVQELLHEPEKDCGHLFLCKNCACKMQSLYSKFQSMEEICRQFGAEGFVEINSNRFSEGIVVFNAELDEFRRVLRSASPVDKEIASTAWKYHGLLLLNRHRRRGSLDLSDIREKLLQIVLVGANQPVRVDENEELPGPSRSIASNNIQPGNSSVSQNGTALPVPNFPSTSARSIRHRTRNTKKMERRGQKKKAVKFTQRGSRNNRGLEHQRPMSPLTHASSTRRRSSGIAYRTRRRTTANNRTFLNQTRPLPQPAEQQPEETRSSNEDNISSNRNEGKVCSTCGKIFSTTYTMKVHHRAVHLHIRPFPCEVCTMRFKQKGHLQKHMNFHRRVTNRTATNPNERTTKKVATKANNQRPDQVNQGHVASTSRRNVVINLPTPEHLLQNRRANLSRRSSSTSYRSDLD